MKVHSAESSLLHPRRVFQKIVLNVWEQRSLAWRFFVREFYTQYRQTYLGFTWVLLSPILLTILFLFLNQSRHPNGSGVLVIMSGMLYWHLFVDSLINPGRLIEASKSLLVKASFPLESLVIASILQNLVNFLLRLVIFLFVALWIQPFPEVARILAAILFALPIIIFGTCLSLLITPFSILYKDFDQGLAIFTTLLLFISPVGYRPERVEASQWYYTWNPISYLVDLPRSVLINLPDVFSWWGYFSLSMGSFVLFILGAVLFTVSLPIVLERVGG